MIVQVVPSTAVSVYLVGSRVQNSTEVGDSPCYIIKVCYYSLFSTVDHRSDCDVRDRDVDARRSLQDEIDISCVDRKR